MTNKVAEDLKRAGCVTVEVGVEAGNPRVRNEILKRHMKDQDIKERQRLNKIVAVATFLRLPLWLVKILIRLPFETVYSLLNVIFKGYSGTVLYPFKWRLKETASTIMDVLRMNDFLVCAEGDVFPDGAIINADSKLLDKQIDEYKKKSNSKNQEASIM